MALIVPIIHCELVTDANNYEEEPAIFYRGGLTYRWNLFDCNRILHQSVHLNEMFHRMT